MKQRVRKDHIENTRRRLNKTKLNIMRTVKTSMWKLLKDMKEALNIWKDILDRMA